MKFLRINLRRNFANRFEKLKIELLTLSSIFIKSAQIYEEKLKQNVELDEKKHISRKKLDLN